MAMQFSIYIVLIQTRSPREIHVLKNCTLDVLGIKPLRLERHLYIFHRIGDRKISSIPVGRDHIHDLRHGLLEF